MPFYQFRCLNNHLKEFRMSFKEHAELPKDETGNYVNCNSESNCKLKAYQLFDGNIGFPGLDTARS